MVRHQTHQQRFLNGKLRTQQNSAKKKQQAGQPQVRHHSNQGEKQSLDQQAPSDKPWSLAEVLKIGSDSASDHHADEQTDTCCKEKRCHGGVAADSPFAREYNSTEPIDNQVAGAAAGGPENVYTQDGRDWSMADDV